MQDFSPDPRARARDAGLARLRRATRFSIFGATALAGAFAGVAAGILLVERLHVDLCRLQSAALCR